MAKRRLSKRQQSTIRQRQQAVLEGSTHSQAHLAGTVVASFGKTLMIEDDDSRLLRCNARQNLGQIVCGDKVVWEESTPEEGVVVAVQPRNNLLTRPDTQGRVRAVAANIDILVVVTSAEPALNTFLLDQYLVAAETLAVDAVIVFNKSDLQTEEAAIKTQQQLEAYRKADYPILYTSTKTNRGIDDLAKVLTGKIGIVVGLSGVGKSSLIKALLPDAELRIGQISAASGQGRHTTTTAQLFHLPCGGNIIDSPGVRQFGLGQIDVEKLAQGFREFHPFLGQCRFRDCRHRDEPGCAITHATTEGRIPAPRLESYQRMLDDVEQRQK